MEQQGQEVMFYEVKLENYVKKNIGLWSKIDGTFWSKMAILWSKFDVSLSKIAI